MKYIDVVAGLAVNRHDEIVIVDSVSPTVLHCFVCGCRI